LIQLQAECVARATVSALRVLGGGRDGPGEHFCHSPSFSLSALFIYFLFLFVLSFFFSFVLSSFFDAISTYLNRPSPCTFSVAVWPITSVSLEFANIFSISFFRGIALGVRSVHIKLNLIVSCYETNEEKLRRVMDCRPSVVNDFAFEKKKKKERLSDRKWL
jgi:hypothetical protein